MKGTLKQYIMNVLILCFSGSRASIEQVNVTPPRVSYGCSDTLVQASSAVCLQNTQEKGRYLVVSYLGT